MTTFETIPDDGEPIPVILVGAGAMGRAWLATIERSPDVRLVGLVDLDTELARTVLDDAGLAEVPVGSSVAELADRTGARAVVNVTVPVAHHPVNTDALFAGLPVLCEKPIAPTVAQALSLAAAAEVTGQLLMTSQSRRYYDTLASFREQVRSLGTVGIATTHFFKAPRFGGFRETMDSPLLVDMAIHAFDASRYLLDAEPVSVFCESFNPTWSWFAGDAATTAIFEFAGGARYIYTGSWVSGGDETSWNGSWRVSGEHGTSIWDGESAPSISLLDDSAGSVIDHVAAGAGEEIAGSLAEFVASLRSGAVPSGEVHSNTVSLAMVEAAVISARTGRRVTIAEVLEEAYTDALEAETRDDVRAALEGWGSASAAI